MCIEEVADFKLRQEAKAMWIKNKKELGQLVDKKESDDQIKALSKLIETHFFSIPTRVALALNKPEVENELTALLKSELDELVAKVHKELR